MSRKALRVALFSPVRLNPYVSLLAAGARQADPSIQVSEWERLTLAWYLHERDCYDIIHLHWAELQYQAGSLRARILRWTSFLLALLGCTRRGVQVVYTVHNVSQHEGRHEHLNRWANRALFAWADAIHVHDRSAAASILPLVQQKEKVFIIPHGSYVGCYPNDVGRGAARATLGLRETDFVYLTLGGLRPYKGIEDLIDAFAHLEGENQRLIIAGHAHEPTYADELRARVASDRRVLAFFGHVPDEQLQIYMNAADVSVFPYRHVTTSGAALLALSFGRPIIAPAIGPFPELVEHSAGIVYEPGDADGLRSALERGRRLSVAASRRAIDDYLQTISWPRVGQQHLMMYRQILGQAAGGQTGALARSEL
jgi:beta-1,4-mannosyltransferase